MGNRAVITTKKGASFTTSEIGIYLHWNGGRDSVEAFLGYCELRGFRPPEIDNYGWAALCTVISNFLGGGMSIGIDRVDKLDCDNGDNGMYIIDNWKIVGRKYFEGHEQNEYDRTEMLLGIDEAQPEKEQLGKEFITAKEVKADSLKVGDQVFVTDFLGEVEKVTVIGFGQCGQIVNGRNVGGMPFTNRIDFKDGYSWNINNYIQEEKVRLAVK